MAGQVTYNLKEKLVLRSRQNLESALCCSLDTVQLAFYNMRATEDAMLDGSAHIHVTIASIGKHVKKWVNNFNGDLSPNITSLIGDDHGIGILTLQARAMCPNPVTIELPDEMQSGTVVISWA